MCNMALHAHCIRSSLLSTRPFPRPPLGSIPSSRSALSASHLRVSVRMPRMPLGGGVRTRQLQWTPPPQAPLLADGERRRISHGTWRSSYSPA